MATACATKDMHTDGNAKKETTVAEKVLEDRTL